MFFATFHTEKSANAHIGSRDSCLRPEGACAGAGTIVLETRPTDTMVGGSESGAAGPVPNLRASAASLVTSQSRQCAAACGLRRGSDEAQVHWPEVLVALVVLVRDGHGDRDLPVH